MINLYTEILVYKNNSNFLAIESRIFSVYIINDYEAQVRPGLELGFE